MCQTLQRTLMATLLEPPLAQIPPTQALLLPRPLQVHSVQADPLGQHQIPTERRLGTLWMRRTPVPADPVLHHPTPM